MAPSKTKALSAAKAVAKGSHSKGVRKVRTKTHFYRPHTLKLARKPKYFRTSTPITGTLDAFTVIKSPVTTEAAMKKVEDNNTLVFITDIRANKRQIKAAAEELYDIKVDRVNTLIRPDGKKKAFIKLPGNIQALDVASKIGVI